MQYVNASENAVREVAGVDWIEAVRSKATSEGLRDKVVERF